MSAPQLCWEHSEPYCVLCGWRGPSLAAELARMTAYFQARTIALHMGADPNTVTTSPGGLIPSSSGSARGIPSSQVDALRADILSEEG